jgi:hypothetical protein
MSTIPQRLSKWFAQPQDILGLASFIGTALYATAQYVTTHNVSLPVLLGGFAASLTAIVIPNGTATGQDVEKLVVDAGTAAIAKNISAAPNVIADVEKVVSDVTTKKEV